MSELRPFRFWCQKVLPLVYDDSLSYYELLYKVVEYLNNTISDVNKLSEEFQTLYNYVHDYFKNLNVQEEINNKLDAMVKSGELDAVFTKYFSIKIPILNVAKMTDISEPVIGTYYTTLNYYNNDNIESTFVVVNSKENAFCLESKNGLYFKNISSPIVEKYGIKPNDSNSATYNTTILSNLLTIFHNAIFNPNNTYYFTNINIPRGVSIDFNNSEIHCISIEINNTPRNDEDVCASLKNGILYCSGDVGIKMTNALRITVDNIMFMEFNVGIHFISGYECIFRNIRAIGKHKNQIGIKVNGGDSHFYDIQMLNVYKAIEINSGINFFTNVHCWLLDNSLFSGSKMIEENTPGGSWNYFDRCYFDTYNYGIYKTGLSIDKLSNIVVICDETLATTANYYMSYLVGDDVKNKLLIYDSIEFRIAKLNTKLLLSNKEGVTSISIPGPHPSAYYSEIYKLMKCQYKVADNVTVTSGRALYFNGNATVTFDLSVTNNTADNPLITINDLFMNPCSEYITIISGDVKTSALLQVRQNAINIRANGTFTTEFTITLPAVVV